MDDASTQDGPAAPARRPGRTWRYEQTLPGESPDVALERATAKFEAGVARLLRTFDRPVRIRVVLEVAELPRTTLEADTEPTEGSESGSGESESTA